MFCAADIVRAVTDSQQRPHDAELLELAKTLAAEAGELVSRRRREGVEVAATKSSIVDVVTAADRECEAFLRARLAELRPEDGFFGEESDPSASASGLTWVVDPIDGTVNYLYGVPNYAVSIAVVDGDPAAEPAAFETIAGVVAAPDLRETYSARRGAGAWRNDAPISVGEGPADITQTLVATGYAYEEDTRALQASIWAGISGTVRDLRRMGAASLDLCAVACGRVDAYYEIGLKPWDWAAGALIAREAGAHVFGHELDTAEGRGRLVAGHPRITGDLQKLLAENTPDALLPSGETRTS